MLNVSITAERDFVALTSFLPLSQTLTSVTYILTIIDDNVFEDTESLTVTAEFDDTISAPIFAPITIIDNDSKKISVIIWVSYVIFLL